MTRRDAISALERQSFAEMCEPGLVTCKVIEVIEVNFLRGLGVDKDPIRRVVSYFTKDGEFLVEKDPTKENNAPINT